MSQKTYNYEISFRRRLLTLPKIFIISLCVLLVYIVVHRKSFTLSGAAHRNSSLLDNFGNALGLPADCPTSLPVLLNLPAFLPAQSTGPNRLCLSQSNIRFLNVYASLSAKLSTSLPPYRPHLHQALSLPQPKLSELQTIIAKPGTITIQYSAEHPNDQNFTQLVHSILPKNNISVVHILVNPNAPDAAQSLQKALQNDSYEVLIHLVRDEHMLYLVHRAPIVFVHAGPIAALAALSVKNHLYFSRAGLHPYVDYNQFRWLLSPLSEAVPKEESTLNSRRFAMMGPVEPSVCKFEGYGIGDGEKVVCTNSLAFSTSNCWIISVGCAGRWSFEEAVVERTQCKVHTFDCTGDWDVPEKLKERVTLHKLCLGAEENKSRMITTWDAMIMIGGGNKAVMPTLAKMDIEGHEYEVIDALFKSENEKLYPQQLAMEVHLRSSDAEGKLITSFFENLYQTGYRLVHRADNPFCNSCSEVTLVRAEGLPTL